MKSIEYAFKSYVGSQAREDGGSYVHTNNLFLVVDGLGIDHGIHYYGLDKYRHNRLGFTGYSMEFRILAPGF